MATITVRNIPSTLYVEVRRQAKLAGRSLNAHVIHLLNRSIAARFSRAGDQSDRRKRRLEELVAEQPYTGNLSTEMLCEDRDKGHSFV